MAQVHTHPYNDHKQRVPEGFATFSEQDFDSLMRSDAHMSMLRSGPYTFMLVKTQQFNKMVEATGNDEEKLAVVAKRMTTTYDRAFNKTKGGFSEKCEAGVLAGEGVEDLGREDDEERVLRGDGPIPRGAVLEE